MKKSKPKAAKGLSPLFLSNRIKLLIFIVLFGAIGSFWILDSQAATPSGSEPVHGLIIQVSTLSPSVTPSMLQSWLEQVRQLNNTTSKSKTRAIDSLVLQDIADQNGNLLTNYLDVIAPYLPGGSSPAVSQAYIGTVDLSWTGAGSKYIEGIENSSFRTLNINLSKTVAQKFMNRYPSVKTDWYITYEANLSGFWDTNIETSYLAYFNQLIPVLSAVNPGKQFLWSPAFWTAYQSEPAWALPGLQTNLTDLFTKTKTPLTIDLQDFVGQSGGITTKEEAQAWITYLKQNWQNLLAGIMINAEQFKQNSNGAIAAGDPVEVPVRENYYYAQSTKLGPAWEIRYWHQRFYGN
jgi:hypothetical protein